MDHHAAQRIAQSATYRKLVQTRSRFGWLLTLVMVTVYFGFICLVAFNKEFLAQTLSEGVMTVSIPIGIGVIIFTILLTGIYVRRANSEFDQLTAEILKGEEK